MRVCVRKVIASLVTWVLVHCYEVSGGYKTFSRVFCLLSFSPPRFLHIVVSIDGLGLSFSVIQRIFLHSIIFQVKTISQMLRKVIAQTLRLLRLVRCSVCFFSALLHGFWGFLSGCKSKNISRGFLPFEHWFESKCPHQVSIVFLSLWLRFFFLCTVFFPPDKSCNCEMLEP